MIRGLVLGISAVGLTGLTASAPAAQASRDWSKSVAATPEGGYRMGNPAAAVKVVEYGSLTCPHCADFTNSAKGPLAARVRTGKVSFEFRNFVLNGVDATATLLARCAAPAQFFPLIERIYATQPQWIAKFSGLTAEQKRQIQAMPESQRPAGVADAIGLTRLAVQGGVTEAKAKSCLADPAALARIDQTKATGTKLGVSGTPTFFVNGAKVHAHNWAELDAEIRKAGG